jgi:hypothetical protein
MESSRPASTWRRSIARVNSINRFSILRPWSATSASVFYGLARMCCFSSLMAGLTNRSLFAEASFLLMRHVALATLPLPFPPTGSRLGERDYARVELKLNRKFSGNEAAPACISGIRMPTCLSSPLLASGRTIETLEDKREWIGFQCLTCVGLEAQGRLYRYESDGRTDNFWLARDRDFASGGRALRISVRSPGRRRSRRCLCSRVP